MSSYGWGAAFFAIGAMLFLQPVSAAPIKLKKNMSLEQTRVEVERAGWHRPGSPHCRHDNSGNNYDKCTGGNFPDAFFHSFPEFYWMPSDISIAGACYQGGADENLEVIFVYDERTLQNPISQQRDFSSFFSRLRLESWRLSKGKCGNDS